MRTSKDLFTDELLEDWTQRSELIQAERFLLNKYLSDTEGRVIEAGTGGGRIAFHVEKMGFKNVEAFDIVPGMIEYALKKASETGSKIKFEVADASNLSNYDDCSYDYLIYLQQVLCFIPEKNQFKNAIKESYRLANQDAVVLFSFLDFDTRIYNSVISLMVNILRFIRRERIRWRFLPWLSIKNKINWKFFHKNQPVTYWLRKEEILAELKHTGFSILEAHHSNQIGRDTKKRKGMLYVVCTKD